MPRIRKEQEKENVRTTDLDVMVAVAGVQEEETGYNTLTYVILNNIFGLGVGHVMCRMKKVI
jgi:hypothetical protein